MTFLSKPKIPLGIEIFNDNQKRSGGLGIMQKKRPE